MCHVGSRDERQGRGYATQHVEIDKTVAFLGHVCPWIPGAKAQQAYAFGTAILSSSRLALLRPAVVVLLSVWKQHAARERDLGYLDVRVDLFAIEEENCFLHRR